MQNIITVMTKDTKKTPIVLVKYINFNVLLEIPLISVYLHVF